MAQAASRSSTSVRPRRAASSGLATVVITMRADEVVSSIRPLPNENDAANTVSPNRSAEWVFRQVFLMSAMCLADPGPVLQYGFCGLRAAARGEDDETAIKFGTSGWRAIVADEFTVANIRLAAAGIAAYVKTLPAPHRVLVGRDPRFLGESFVAEAARVLAGAGVTPIVIPEAAPTPAIAYAVRR